MNIEAALLDVENLYVESAPLIYYVEQHLTYSAKMNWVVDLIETTSLKAFSSVLTLAEVLVMPLKTGDGPLAQEYHDILVNSGGYTLVSVTAEIAVSAADIRARYNLRTPDALHVATAVATDCDAMLTNDTDMKRVRELSILVLDELYL